MDKYTAPRYASPVHTPRFPAPGDHATELLCLAADYPAFRSPEGQAFVSIPFGPTGRQIVALHSPNLRDHLTSRFHETFNVFPKPRALAEAIRRLSAEAFGPGNSMYPAERPVFLRLAALPSQIVLDLLDNGQTVEIGPSSWSVADSNPACFQRTRSHAPLPHPVQTETPDFEPLARCLRLSHDRPAFLRILTWLLTAMRPGTGPYPILLLRGPSGSGKSTTARILKSLIDPSHAPLLPAPTSRRSLMRDASNNWVLAFDHVSKLPTQVSDTLCTLTSGIAHTFRDGGRTVTQNLLRPIILVATDRLKLHPDLAARCLIVDLEPPEPTEEPARENPADAFDGLRSAILGSLCTAVSQAMSGKFIYATPEELAEALKPVPSRLVQSLHKLGGFKGSATDLARALDWRSTPRHISQHLRDVTDPAFTIRFFHRRGERKIEISLSASPPGPAPEGPIPEAPRPGGA